MLMDVESSRTLSPRHVLSASLPSPPTCTIPWELQKKVGEIAEFWKEIQNSRSWVTGRLKMMCLCLEGGWVNTYSPNSSGCCNRWTLAQLGGQKVKEQ